MTKFKIEDWEKLTISNDFIFSKLMRDEELCKEVITILLGIKVKKIKYIEQQKTINITNDQKSIRLDVYVEDGDKIINIEMQTANEEGLLKRARYYQALIDLNTIEKGEIYNKLKESYVVFICTFDPFKRKYPRYTFENICLEDKALKFNDGTHKVFFNTKKYEDTENEKLKLFLKYVNGETSDDDFIKKLEERIQQIKGNKEWRVEYMNLLIREQEKFEQGAYSNKIETAKEMLLENEPIEKIMKYSKLSQEEIEKIQGSMLVTN